MSQTVPVQADSYKWVALSNTTLGMLAASINSSILLISLPAVFRGIGLKALDPGNINYLLWAIIGYMIATAVLVVAFGRLGDQFGRARMYNLGFAIREEDDSLPATAFAGSRFGDWKEGRIPFMRRWPQRY